MKPWQRHKSEHGKWFERPRENQPGTKLIKRFIKDARGEQIKYRADLLRMTGEQLP